MNIDALYTVGLLLIVLALGMVWLPLAPFSLGAAVCAGAYGLQQRAQAEDGDG